MLPRLAKKFTVIAVDLRGVGGSSPTPSGYDVANMAEDVHQLARQLNLERVYVAGHDIGGMVAYAFVRLHPTAACGVMILEAPLPGIEPWAEVKRDPMIWHSNFHQTPDFARKVNRGSAKSLLQTFFYRLHIQQKSDHRG